MATIACAVGLGVGAIIEGPGVCSQRLGVDRDGRAEQSLQSAAKLPTSERERTTMPRHPDVRTMRQPGSSSAVVTISASIGVPRFASPRGYIPPRCRDGENVLSPRPEMLTTIR